MKNLRVNNYELSAEQITAHVSDGKQHIEYAIDRAGFEHWLTDGTGEVDMSIAHSADNVITEVPIKEPIASYWQQGEEVNNSPVLFHLQQYICRNEAAVSEVKAAFAEEQLKDIFEQMAPGVRAEAYATLLEYGLLKKESGFNSQWLNGSRLFSRAGNGSNGCLNSSFTPYIPLTPPVC